MPIDNLVLITGAGASRELGGAQQSLPLMTDWAAILRKALDQEELGLSALVGIHEGQTGPEFEQAVGDFLAWHQVLPLAARYLPFGLDRAARLQGDVRDWDQRASYRASKVVGVLHRTLYEQFGGGRINPETAKTSYGTLLGALEFSSGRTITVATTNYDPGAEVAFAELGLPPDVGEAAGPGGAPRAASRRPVRPRAPWCRTCTASARCGGLVDPAGRHRPDTAARHALWRLRRRTDCLAARPAEEAYSRACRTGSLGAV